VRCKRCGRYCNCLHGCLGLCSSMTDCIGNWVGSGGMGCLDSDAPLKFANGSMADSALVAGMSGMCILLGLSSLN